ncbi:DNA polymerase IV [Candidatus Promineifilum breve]|uniref:DNA polymerase IV n=1 Tax=Candidatus Promineifilum breve TaxID=1806508 RepID=A0A160T7C7_9CHLR|nr:DNA polymerase IV [Candidatus Promineifilum breve]CUS05984.1 DNA polymerase IV [Candidatus Promineifilum breve]
MHWSRAILHVDMDAFYVNVHLLDHPADGGRPLAVGGRPDERGVVTSASYEARALGVRSAMPMAQALRLAPGMLVVPPDWSRIRECSRAVMAVLEQYGPLEQMSVDEAYIDLSGAADPPALAAEARDRVPAETKMPASVGLATSKLVAKVASDFNKPRGLTVVLPGEEAAFLAPQSVRAIWGIGPRTAERLAALGIATCGQLAAADADRLRAAFGREADNLLRRARGEDDRPVTPDRGPAKSISQEWTFNRDVGDAAVLRDYLEKMSAEVAEQLQKNNLIAHTVRVKFRWSDFTTFTRQRSLEVGTDDAATILRVAELLWRENWPQGRPMRLLGVGATGLVEGEGRQLGLFG